MRFRSPMWGAMMVCVGVFAFAYDARAATIAVPPGGDLQAAINAAMPGDVITLAPGAVYTGNFTLPDKGASTQFITIRSAAPDSVLPPAGVRVTPAYAAQLPKIESATSVSSLRTKNYAHHWKLMFLEFRANMSGYGDIMQLGSGDTSQTDLTQVAHDIVVDRVYVHGDPVMGQKRGIALNSRDTQILNCYIADIKAVGQDSQALGGFNGPGNYVIENNYLEAAAENFLIGGADPPIRNLVTTNIVFRRNYLRKPLEWRNPIIATPQNATASAAPGAGSLAAGTYAYRVVARVPAGQTTKANSAATAEVSATIAAGLTGGVTISWTPVAGASDYLVYGRTSGAINQYWKTTNAFVTDNGAAGTSGTVPSTTKWVVKNLFELKNAQDVVVEGNVFENNWVGDQPGYAIVFTPRNQSGTAPWSVVQRVTFRQNLVRHTAGGVNILGTDNINPSQLTNNLTISDNIWDDVGTAWGTGAKTFQMGDGGDRFTFDHNTVDSNDSSLVAPYGGSASSPTPITNFVYTNNMAEHRTYGFMGANMASGLSTINAYFPSAVIRRNVLAGGSASKYPADNFFPAVTTWKSGFAAFDNSDYQLLVSSGYLNAGTDGVDLGANVSAVNAQSANALSGDNRLPPGTNHVQITTTSLPNGMLHAAYAQSLACGGGTTACAWAVVDATLPAGLAFDPVAAVVAGTASAVETGTLTVKAYDPSWPTNDATATLTVTIDPPPFTMTIPAAAEGQVGSTYSIQPTASGAVGSVSWSVVSGSLPAGLGLDAATGSITGTPAVWGSSTATVQAQDSWQPGRAAAQPLTIVVSPAPIGVATSSLGSGMYQQYFQAVLSANGGSGSTTWAITGGALSAGLMADASGSVSGTPTGIGTFTVTVQATDANWPSHQATASLALTINAPAFAASMPVAPAGQVGAAYQLAGSASGQVGSVVWSVVSGALPGGLTLNASTGVVSGTPAAAGVFSATVQARDSWNATRVVNIPVVIAVISRDVVLYAADATRIAGAWSLVADTTAAAGKRLANPDANAAKLTTPLASPVSYFEITFQAEAGVGYHLWMRGKADKNYWGNDSAYVQFSDSVTPAGAAVSRIGSTSAQTVSIENGANAGLSGWGWNDDSYEGLAPALYFASTGTHTVRVQVREDGLSIDQIVLSPDTYLNAAPGAAKNDTTIVSR